MLRHVSEREAPAPHPDPPPAARGEGDRQRGMALLEVAIGAALVAAIVVESLAAIESTCRLGDYDRNERRAVEAAQAKIAYLRTHDFKTLAADIAAESTLNAFAVADLPIRRTLDAFGKPLPAGSIEAFTVAGAVPFELGGPFDPTDGDATYHVLPVRVRVTWGAAPGSPVPEHSITLDTILNEGDAVR